MNVAFVDERDDPAPLPDLEPLAALVLAGEGVPPGAEVAVTFVDPEEMAGLNDEHLGTPGPTDVLSFPLEDLAPGVPPVADPGGPPVTLGDIVICPAYVRSVVGWDEDGYCDELALMVVHGLLHLLGYDHVDDAEAELMEARERHYLAQVGRRRR